MNSSALAQIDLSPRSSAREYRKLYGQVRDLATQRDNTRADSKRNGGEVRLSEAVAPDEFVSLRFDHDDGYNREHFTVSRSTRSESGEIESVETLRGTARGQGFYKFEHASLTQGDGKRNDSSSTYTINVQRGTITQHSWRS